jgi:hypothetical protein
MAPLERCCSDFLLYDVPFKAASSSANYGGLVSTAVSQGGWDMRRHLALVIVAVLAVVLVAHAWGQQSWVQPPGRTTPGFQGYWMGVDPVDGGDSRRTLVQLGNGQFALAGRDSVLTLCDGTDRGFASFNDGEVVRRHVMQSNTLTLRCFNNGASVVLHVEYELIGNGLMLEVTTRPDGSPVSTIVFHKVSED